MRAHLVPLDGGPPLEIAKDLVIVGRKEDCDIQLDHRSVSKLHCVLVKTEGLLMLRDLGSTNGTRVNGTRVRRAALLPNDQVAISHFQFRVDLGPVGSPAPHAVSDRTQMLDADELAQLEAERKHKNGAAMKPAKPEKSERKPTVEKDSELSDA
ncbi:MAG: FHA domain-containing protein [Gemmataceae bacterium]